MKARILACKSEVLQQLSGLGLGLYIYPGPAALGLAISGT